MGGTTYTLKVPVQLGEQTITELTLTPVCLAFKGFKQKVYPDGSVEFDTYAAAHCGVRMTGHPPVLGDKLHPADMMGLGTLALSFFEIGQPTGKTL